MKFNKYDYVLVKDQEPILGQIINIPNEGHGNIYEVQFILLEHSNIVSNEVMLSGSDLIPCYVDPSKHRNGIRSKYEDFYYNEVNKNGRKR